MPEAWEVGTGGLHGNQHPGPCLPILRVRTSGSSTILLVSLKPTRDTRLHGLALILHPSLVSGVITVVFYRGGFSLGLLSLRPLSSSSVVIWYYKSKN